METLMNRVVAPRISRRSAFQAKNSATVALATPKAATRSVTPIHRPFGTFKELTLTEQAVRSGRTSSVRVSNAMATASPATFLEDKDKQSFIDTVDTFIFDCDGVIWKGDSIIDGVPEALDMLKAKGKKTIFVTNNSTKSRAGYLKKFHGLGLTNVKAEEIFSSSFAAAAYFQSINMKKKVYVVGEVGIQEELDLAGIAHIGGPADGEKKIDLSPGQFMEHDPDVGAVCVGFDRNINYYKIQYATLCLRENPGCIFVGTNLDAVTHLTDAQEWAGNGSMVGAIKGSSGKEPTVVGKPAPFMLDYICKQNNIKPEQICMVGDRLDTDIQFGIDGGLRTLLVLSGVTTEETLKSPENAIQPDYYVSAMPDMLSVFK